jgi:hypothetical protein
MPHCLSRSPVRRVLVQASWVGQRARQGQRHRSPSSSWRARSAHTGPVALFRSPGGGGTHQARTRPHHSAGGSTAAPTPDLERAPVRVGRRRRPRLGPNPGSQASPFETRWCGSCCTSVDSPACHVLSWASCRPVIPANRCKPRAQPIEFRRARSVSSSWRVGQRRLRARSRSSRLHHRPSGHGSTVQPQRVK